MPKRKFIDKKHSVTFHLVHRSQQDPLVADENAPQHVLVPINDSKSTKPKAKKEELVEEEHKYGIYYDDDYDYLQHLKTSNTIVEWVPTESKNKKKDCSAGEMSEQAMKLKLPSSVFASTVEDDVGMLNKAAPSGLRLDLDPDIVAAMDEDFDYEDPENELEDNFMELANAEGPGDEEYCEDEEEEGSAEEEEEDMSSCFDEEEMDDVASLDGGQMSFMDEETKSRFTEYSMTSSVMRRNEQLTLLDDRFERMYAKYDENEMGALDCDEIEGYIPGTSDLLLQYAADFEKQQKREHLDKSDVKLHTKLALIESDSEEDDDNELVNMEVKPKEKWDCESILSTYSNLYNRPKLISEPKRTQDKIKLNAKGIPVIESNRLTAKALSRLDNETSDNQGKTQSVANSVLSTLSALSIRPDGETPEERRERKKKLREYRRERRIERKANSDAFKEESKRQKKIQINNQNNIQGNRIL